MTNSSAMVVLLAREVQQTAEFLRDELDFRITSIFPADDPATAELDGHGLNLVLERSDHIDSNRIRIHTDSEVLPGKPKPVFAPNGTQFEIVSGDDSLVVPELKPELVISRASENDQWVAGRAGMQYRDLIPGRLGGRFIASHIRIPDGGPVPDYVHYHQIRFQLIYCYRGWVKVVYEDQGEPFVMEAGDCVLQPPLIRHRVLESSPGLEVVEIGCPAEHYTRVDHDLALPNNTVNQQRDFSGQQFVRHQASNAIWDRWQEPGFRCRDSGIGIATDNLAGVRVVKPEHLDVTVSISNNNEFQFWFVLEGKLRIEMQDNKTIHLNGGDSIAIPANTRGQMQPTDAGLEFLEVTLPA